MRTPAFVGALSFALLSFFALLPAVTPAARADDWTTYAHPNDLRDVTVAGGTLWCAGTGGAVSYDLATGTFRQFPRRLAGGPVSQDLTSVAYDATNGLVYFGSADAGVSQYRVADDTWRRFDEIPNNEIRSVTSARGELYVATASGFSIRRSATRTDLCNDIDRACCGLQGEACDFPSFDVRDFALVDTVLWAVTAGGPAELRAGLWHPHVNADVLDGRSLEGFNGTAWLATRAAQGVYHWDAPSQSWSASGGGLPGGALGDGVRLVNSGGELLLCGDIGLYRLDGGDWVSLGMDRGVRSVVKVEGTYYCCTREGLFKGNPGAWTQLQASGPPLNSAGQAIAVASDGTLWLGTLSGAMGLSTDGAWSVYRNGEGGIARFEIFSIFVDATDRLWLGKCCCREVGKCPTQFVRKEGTVSAELGAYDGWGMSEDGGHRLWIGSNFGGVYVLNPDGSLLTELTGENTGSNLHSTSVRATAADGNLVWLGYEDKGLSIIDTKGDPANVAGYSWSYFSGSSGSQLPDATVSDIEVVGSNDAWVLTSANLVHFQNKQKVKQVSLNLGGEPRRGNALAVDSKGTKWVATSSGVLRVDRNDNVSVLNTGNSDLISNEVLDVAVDPRNDEILFETRLGASRLHEVAAPNAAGDEAFAYPNPFLPDGTNRLNVGGSTAESGSVYDVAGRPVARFALADGWDGRDTAGQLAAPGLYLVVAGGRACAWR